MELNFVFENNSYQSRMIEEYLELTEKASKLSKYLNSVHEKDMENDKLMVDQLKSMRDYIDVLGSRIALVFKRDLEDYAEKLNVEFKLKPIWQEYGSITIDNPWVTSIFPYVGTSTIKYDAQDCVPKPVNLSEVSK